MKERPILFSSAMVRALLDGRKTQTRRVMKPQPEWIDGVGDFMWESSKCQTMLEMRDVLSMSPYGIPKNELWVRERQRVINIIRDVHAGPAIAIQVRYEADGNESNFIPYPERLNGRVEVGKCLSYGGYRESSRIQLGITKIRAERVQDITEEDAKAEGATLFADRFPDWPEQTLTTGERAMESPYRSGFAVLWDELNASRGFTWKSNPWTWVVDFKHLEQHEPL